MLTADSMGAGNEVCYQVSPLKEKFSHPPTKDVQLRSGAHSRTRSLAFGAPVFVRMQNKGHLGCSLKEWYMETDWLEGRRLEQRNNIHLCKENAREKGIYFLNTF